MASVWPLDQAKKGFLECKNSVLFIGTQDNFKLPGRRSALLSRKGREVKDRREVKEHRGGRGKEGTRVERWAGNTWWQS